MIKIALKNMQESHHTSLMFTKIIQLLLSRFSRVRLCATPETAAHQAPQSLGFSRQEHWSGLPFPSPMHENEKWKRSCSVVSDSSWSHGLQPTGLLHPWDFQARVLEWGAIAFSSVLGVILNACKFFSHGFILTVLPGNTWEYTHILQEPKHYPTH